MNTKQKLQTGILADQIRIHIVEMLMNAGSGHAGGSLSLADTLAVLYENHMRINPKDPQNPKRDVLVLSKGHAGPALYSVLAEKGFFDPEQLMNLNKGGTMLPSHPDRLKTPGVDMTTGSLGQGCSLAAGMALAQKKRNLPYYTYCIAGDGELAEGQCWEAFEFMAARELDNCIVLIDWNKKQLDGLVEEVLNPQSFADKMKAFGFETVQVDGHDLEAVNTAIENAKQTKGKPSCIVLDTVKGKGIPMIETMEYNHSISFAKEELKEHCLECLQALKEDIQKKECLCTQLQTTEI